MKKRLLIALIIYSRVRLSYENTCNMASDGSNEKIIGYIELADEYKGSFDDNQVQQFIIQFGAISKSLPLLSSEKIDYTSLLEKYKES